MTTNPYDSPQIESSPEVVDPDVPPRPIGITILSVLGFLSAVGLMITAAMLLIEFEAAWGSRNRWQSLTTVGLTVVFPLLILVVAIGLWCGNPWGWWLGAFYFVYSVVSNVAFMASMMDLEEAFDERDRIHFAMFWMLDGAFIFIFGAIACYFFKSNVLRFFKLHHLHRGKAVAILFGIALVLAFAQFLFSNRPL